MTYPGSRSVRCRPYRLNDEIRGHMDKQLNELLEAGVISKDNESAFASTVIMVKKKNREFRFVVDMRYLNRISLPLFHELPVFEDILDVMTRNKAKVLSTLDIRSAYHQLPLTEQSSRLTSFITPHRGGFRFKRLLQGHSQSPFWMQMALNKLFRNQIGIYLLVHLDNVICVRNSPAKHLEHLTTSFEKFRQAELKLHPSKCKFF